MSSNAHQCNIAEQGAKNVTRASSLPSANEAADQIGLVLDWRTASSTCLMSTNAPALLGPGADASARAACLEKIRVHAAAKLESAVAADQNHTQNPG